MGTQCDGTCSQHSGTVQNVANLKEEVNYLHNSNKELRAGQALISKAIVRMTTNMEVLGRIEDRVLTLEGKIGKIVGGLMLASIVIPIVITAVATVSVVYLGKPQQRPQIVAPTHTIATQEEKKWEQPVPQP